MLFDWLILSFNLKLQIYDVCVWSNDAQNKIVKSIEIYTSNKKSS